MQKLYIIAVFHFKENYLLDAIELLKKLVVETRKENGCLQYDLVEDRENKGVFFLSELWESDEAHHQHNGQHHLLDFRKNASPLLEKSIEIYKGYKIF